MPPLEVDASLKQKASNLCRHGKQVCNRSLGGRECQKNECIESGKLCHDPDCAKNKGRSRPSAQQKRKAKDLAKETEHILNMLGPEDVAKWISDDGKTLGQKLKACQVLTSMDPCNFANSVRDAVIVELQKVRSNDSVAHRIRQWAADELTRWI